MDGLLFDTEPLYWQVGTTVLGRRGKVYTDQLRRDMMGRPGPDAIQLMIRTESLTDHWQDLLLEAETEFLRLAAADLVHMPGLDRLLATLHEHKLPFGVATSSRRAVAENLLGRAGLTPHLTFILTGDDITHGKPHPEMYQRAAAAMQIAPANMLVLEDSGNGCKAGVASGACAIAVPGHHSRDHDFNGVAWIAERLDDPVIIDLLTR